ncbi:MAG: hypothetical protein IKB16_04805 [Lentisphaeria bacterium]|nr:hypothetical protein [Lentisphaeria bacterium]
MTSALKQNIRKTGIFLLLSALIPILAAGIMRFSDWRQSAVAVLILLYYLFCLFILIRTCTQIIWQLPCKKVWRLLLFAGWVLIYPILSLLWASQVMIWLALGFQ